MKKLISITIVILCLCTLLSSALPASAETTTAEEKTTVEEKTTERETTPAEEKTTEEKTTKAPVTKEEVIYISFKNEDPMNPMPKYVYTGKEIKPQVVVTREDRSELDKSEYTLEYEGDFVNPGMHTIYAVYKKNGYKIGATFWIIPGRTDKINVKVKDGKVTVSWNPVPGAGVYRVYKYDETKGYYSEMWWSADEIASPKTSRTFTKEELKPGGKYKMAIMALPAINWMPTDQMAYFTVDTTKDTDTTQKVTVTEKQTQKIEKTTLAAPQTTKLEEATAVVTEETGTGAENTEPTIAVNGNDAETEKETLADVQVDSSGTEDEKAPLDRTKLAIIIVVCVLAIGGIVFSVYKKKKQ